MPGTQPDQSDPQIPVVQAGFSIFGQTRPASQPQAKHLRVASLDPNVGLGEVGAQEPRPEVAVIKSASFDERFASLAEPNVSFDERFGSIKPESTGSLKSPQLDEFESADQPGADQPGKDQPRADQSGAKQSDTPPLPPVAKHAVRPSEARQDAAPTADNMGRTAIYDISARVVYLPNGRRLEAHSGLGQYRDSPRYVNLRMRGATPPNLYKLTERERLFHGVRALRMTPTNHSKMYGRAGILAHTYMLGPNGQSNGCVSFKDYQAFLNAYLKGEVTHLAVVDRLDNPPGPKFASGWLPDVIRNMFTPSDTAAYANAQ